MIESDEDRLLEYEVVEDLLRPSDRRRYYKVKYVDLLILQDLYIILRSQSKIDIIAQLVTGLFSN